MEVEPDDTSRLHDLCQICTAEPQSLEGVSYLALVVSLEASGGEDSGYEEEGVGAADAMLEFERADEDGARGDELVGPVKGVLLVLLYIEEVVDKGYEELDQISISLVGPCECPRASNQAVHTSSLSLWSLALTTWN